MIKIHNLYFKTFPFFFRYSYQIIHLHYEENENTRLKIDLIQNVKYLEKHALPWETPWETRCTPFAKSNGRFFHTQKSTCPIWTIFGRFLKCILVISGHFLWKIYWLLTLTRFALRFKGDVVFSKLSLNIIVNFKGWNSTDSGEILETLILTRCLNLVQISWRFASLLQNHSRKSVGHCVRLSAGLCMQK